MLAHAQPGIQVARERERLAALRAHGRVHGERVQRVHGGGADGADDPGGADDVPADAGVGAAVGEEQVLLLVVEVGLERDARVALGGGRAVASEVQAVVLGAGLQQDARGREGGERQRFEEVAEQCRWSAGVAVISERV